MNSYLDCWVRVATSLLPQALAGEPQLVDAFPGPFGAGAFGFAATLSGDLAGRFSVLIDASILEASLLGEDVDQKTAWGQLLREAAEAAAGEVLASTGKTCRMAKFEECGEENKVTRAFELRSGERVWKMLVRDGVRVATDQAKAKAPAPLPPSPSAPEPPAHKSQLSPGLELLLDVELEASLRFGSREMPLEEILELGPGDVVQLDRHVADPVDLLVGDKIVARGEVVLVNDNFGLRVTEVAAPQKRLESIRCLF